LLTHVVVLRPAWLVALVALLAGFWLPKGGWLWLWLPLVAALLYAISTGVTYRPARAFGLVVPARHAVVRAVERARSELPTSVQGVEELTWLMPNALAFPLLGRIAFTQACADALDEDALSAIALHELGHLNEPKSLRWFRPLLALSLLPVAAVTLLSNGHFELLLGLVLFSLLLVVFGLRLTRRLEQAADAHAAEYSRVYASALESLHRAAGIPAVTSKRTSHPSLYDRMLAAGAVPSYPRPKPPRTGVVWLSLIWVPIAMVGLDLLRSPVRDGLAQGAGDQAATVRAALGGGPMALLDVASEQRDDVVLREMLIDRALQSAPNNRWVLRKVARLRNLDCPKIREMLATSRRRSESDTVPSPSAFWQCRRLSVPEVSDSTPD
jgi:Zn-dependent protease with chaperone function